MRKIKLEDRDNSRRNRTGKSVCITVSLPSNMLNNIDAICANTGEKRSTTVQAMIRAGFAHKKITEAEKEWDGKTKLEIAKRLYFEALEQCTLEDSYEKEIKKHG